MAHRFYPLIKEEVEKNKDLLVLEEIGPLACDAAGKLLSIQLWSRRNKKTICKTAPYLI